MSHSYSERSENDLKITKRLQSMMLFYRLAWSGIILFFLSEFLSRWYQWLQIMSIMLIYATLICVGVTLFYMYKAASLVTSRWWAWKQVILAILLSPLFGIGWILIPLMVKSNLEKWVSSELSTKKTPSL